MKGIILSVLCVAAVLAFAACSSKGEVMDGDGMVNSYTQISQEQAAEMMKLEGGQIVVDVRRQDEYDEYHIPGAICIPNESIGTEMPEELPDKEQIILIYCRSGRRSKEAAQKLFDMGYKNVYEFGGIIDWKGDVVYGETSETAASVSETSLSGNDDTTADAQLSFDSFDGGGPEYNVVIDDSDVLSYTENRVYHQKDHEQLDGAGFDVIFTFKGLKQGETKITVTNTIDDTAEVFSAKVDDGLNVIISELSTDMQNDTSVVVAINGADFDVELEDNSSAKAFAEKIKSSPLTLDMNDYGGFEKNAHLGFELPTNDTEIVTQAGDIILYQGDTLALYYDENRWQLTKLGHINADKDELLEAFGDGEVSVVFRAE